MTELPSGWAEASLEDLVASTNHSLAIGPFGSNLKVSDYEQSGTPLIFVRNIRARDFDLVPTFVSEHKAFELAAHLVRPGDLLVTKMGDPPGDVAIYPQGRPNAVLTADCIKATAHPLVSGPYLSFAIEGPGCAGQVAAMTSGVAQRKVNLAKFRKLRVRVAPAAEQQRIVVAIEEAFSKLDVGEVGLHTARQLIKRMRDAVLAAAVTGRLVPQDPTDAPATKLLADLGVGAIDIGDVAALPDGWAWATLGSISESVRNGLFVSRPPEVPPGVPILRIGAVRRLDLDLSDLRFAAVDIDDPVVARALLSPGDLLFTRYNGNPAFVGACAVVPSVEGPLLHPDKLIRVVVNRAAAEPTFVAIAASAGASRTFIEGATKTTAGQAGIAGSDLRLVPIPLAPLEEQRRIVSEIERQFSFLDACARAVDAGLARSVALRRSVLKAAFEGQMVEQDPGDEPASALLERIRSERAAAPKRPQRTRTTA